MSQGWNTDETRIKNAMYTTCGDPHYRPTPFFIRVSSVFHPWLKRTRLTND